MEKKERSLYINQKDIKTMVSKELCKKYEEISVEYNDEPELIIEVKQGCFTEQVLFQDERILRALGFPTDNLKLIYVDIDESRYEYLVGAKDEGQFYCFNCEEIEVA
jgi:hypothetical protein